MVVTSRGRCNAGLVCRACGAAAPAVGIGDSMWLEHDRAFNNTCHPNCQLTVNHKCHLGDVIVTEPLKPSHIVNYKCNFE